MYNLKDIKAINSFLKSYENEYIYLSTTDTWADLQWGGKVFQFMHHDVLVPSLLSLLICFFY